MIPVLEGVNFISAAEFTQALNKARLKNKRSWIVYSGWVAGHRVEIKTFDTGYLQLLRVDGLQTNTKQYDLKVGVWKSEIERGINGV